MTTPCFDLACKAMRAYVKALRDPACGPMRIEAHFKAAQLCMQAVLANLENETATLEDAVKIAKNRTLYADAMEARFWAERRLGELLVSQDESAS